MIHSYCLLDKNNCSYDSFEQFLLSLLDYYFCLLNLLVGIEYTPAAFPAKYVCILNYYYLRVY